MDHDATREQLELAAVEPGGIDRLVAGDTATAQAVAAHLAGCPDCAGELARLERASRLIATSLREMPPVDLRERTLASVQALGRARGATAAPGLAGTVAVEPFPARPVPVPARPTAADTAAGTSSGRGRGAALGWVAAIAAAIVLSVAATSLLVGGRVDQQLADQSETIHTLQEVTTATLRVSGEPDARARRAGQHGWPGPAGSLVFSPSTSELVVVATGLAQPPAGQEYRCWVELAGQRQRVGKMFFSGDLAYWIGPVSAVSGVSSGARFGVSLVDASGSADRRTARARRRALSRLRIDFVPLVHLVGRRRAEIGAMEQEQAVGCLGTDVVAVLGHDHGQPGRLARTFDRVDLRLAPARVHDDEPDQPGAQDQADDQQPDIEFSVHGRPV